MPQLVYGDQSTTRKEAVLAFQHMGLGNQTQATRLDSAFTCSAIWAARRLVCVVPSSYELTQRPVSARQALHQLVHLSPPNTFLSIFLLMNGFTEHYLHMNFYFFPCHCCFQPLMITQIIYLLVISFLHKGHCEGPFFWLRSFSIQNL